MKRKSTGPVSAKKRSKKAASTPKPLPLATEQVEIDAGEYSGIVSTILELLEKKPNYECCRRVGVEIKLQKKGKRKSERAGFLVAWLVDKTAESKDDKPAWVAELLQSGDLEDGDETGELHTVMQELFTQAGQPRRGVKRGRTKKVEHREQILEEKVLFMDTLKLEKEYRGKGIAQVAVQSSHDIVSRELEVKTIVLSPALSNEETPEPDKTVLDVEQGYIRSYGKSGYEVWIQGQEAVEGSVTVMGISLNEQEEVSVNSHLLKGQK